MSDSDPKTFYLPRFDSNTLKSVLTGPLPNREYVFADYTIAPKQGISLPEAIARAAIVASCRSQRAYHHESQPEWLNRAAKVTKYSHDGFAQIAYPAEMFGEREGVSKLLAVLTCGGEHDFVDQFWLHEFTLPPTVLVRFGGPQFGIDGIRGKLGKSTGPIIGVTVRPLCDPKRYNDELIHYKAALRGGADYLTDDILFSDNQDEWEIETRARRLVHLCREMTEETGHPKSYVVNLAVDEGQLPAITTLLHEIGVAIVKVNAFFSGFGTLLSLRTSSKMPLIATNIGVSLLTRPADTAEKRLGTGVSEAVISKLSRLCGADGVHLGSIDTGSFVVQSYDPAILALASSLGSLKPSIAVLGDNVNVGNLWQNLRNFGRDVMIESSSGIMSYPSGPEKGAAVFKELATRLADVDDPGLAHEVLVARAKNDSHLMAELEASGYREVQSRMES